MGLVSNVVFTGNRGHVASYVLFFPLISLLLFPCLLFVVLSIVSASQVTVIGNKSRSRSEVAKEIECDHVWVECRVLEHKE